MFDFDISLFMFRMWITVISYCDCSHAKNVDYCCKLFGLKS